MFAPRYVPAEAYGQSSSESEELEASVEFHRKRRRSSSGSDSEIQIAEDIDSQHSEDSDGLSSQSEPISTKEVRIDDSSKNDSDQSSMESGGDRIKENGTYLSPSEDDVYLSKHKSIFEKLHSSIAHLENVSMSNDEGSDVEMLDLGPLPQPELPKDKLTSTISRYQGNLNWLAQPHFISINFSKPFCQFSELLSPFLLRNLQKMGFKDAFAVQVSVLDILLQEYQKNSLKPDRKSDLLVNAVTGSGKTLAYLIPIIQVLHSRVVPRTRAVIILPTKPLVVQVKALMDQLAKGANLSIVSLKTGVSVNTESLKLKENVPDIIISTPGRLVEHINNKSINLDSLRFLVIDEADRLLNQSFQNWCKILMGAIETENAIAKRDIFSTYRYSVQKLIFSATLTTDAKKLSLLEFFKPKLIVVNEDDELRNEMFNVPATLSEYLIKFGTSRSFHKPLILAKFLISQNKLSNVLVFVKSNEASLRLKHLLQILFNKMVPGLGINVSYINSSNNTSSLRSRILKDFANELVNVLIATDLISRGIDILSIKDVINYDLPQSSREYVHRVGRTARANKMGSAFSFCFGKGEQKWFQTLISTVGRGNKHVQDIDIEYKDLISIADEELYATSLISLRERL